MYTYTQRYKHVCINECMCAYIGSGKSWCAGTRGLIFFLFRALSLSLPLSLSLSLSLSLRAIFFMPLCTTLSISTRGPLFCLVLSRCLTHACVHLHTRTRTHTPAQYDLPQLSRQISFSIYCCYLRLCSYLYYSAFYYQRHRDRVLPALHLLML